MKTAAVAAIILLLMFFQCGPSSGTKETPTAGSADADIIWVVDLPEGFVANLFTDEALTNESCWDCVIGDLQPGTELAPRWEGCQRAEWDASYTYCHVKVLTGDLAGKLGWVNANHVAERAR